MVFSAFVVWWQSVQVYIAVGGTGAAQLLLSVSGFARKSHIPPWVRCFIWLAFIASDALVIYALAALLNRPTLQQDIRTQSIGRHDLQVFWAPILLIYLGGQPMMTAYDIEDNELWGRTLLTTPFQIGAALYVFYTSWPSTSADKRLSTAALCLFFTGGVKYLQKVLSLRSASFDTMSDRSNKAKMSHKDRKEDFGQYIEIAQKAVGNNHGKKVSKKVLQGHYEELVVVDKLFVDVYVYPYSDRIKILECFWELNEEEAYKALKFGLSHMFDIFYTRNIINPMRGHYVFFVSLIAWIVGIALQIVAFIHFCKSHKRGYSHLDVVLTFVLLIIIFVQEFISALAMLLQVEIWPEKVAQHSIIGALALNKRSAIWKCTAGFRMEYFYKYFFMDYCRSSEKITGRSSEKITGLVRQHVKAGWMRIKDVDSYREFSDTRGQFTLKNCYSECFRQSLEKPFDESIVLWHLATDFCHHHHESISSGSVEDGYRLRAREISKYMIHLLVAHPEMLMAGSRRNLFTTAYKEVERLLGQETSDHEAMLTKKLIAEMIKSGETLNERIVREAWSLAKGLMDLDGGEERWKMIQDVWVEKLCFSAGRCRGFFHAKALGSGGEYLSYVWLLLAHAGMETFSERLQRTQPQVHLNP